MATFSSQRQGQMPTIKILVYMMLVWMLVSAFEDNCPYEICECDDETIDCNYIELTTLPEVHPVNLTKLLFLSVMNNQLTTIKADGLPQGLWGIGFQQNPIRTIEQAAFDDLADTLTSLAFSQANFTELPSALLHLNTLKRLTIGDTQIRTWDVDILKHISLTLEALILTNVGLTSWPMWVPYLSHIDTLELSSMPFFQVPDDAFDNQINTLFSLNLENCSLTEIPSSLSKLTVLKYLVLDSNNISKLTGVPNSTTLTTLTLDGNNISDAGHLSEALRPIAKSLTVLQLMTNQLTSMPDMSAMMKLNTLYLSQNAISSIGIAKMPPSLTYLGLENNNLPSLYSFMQTGVGLNVLKFHSNFIKEIRGLDIPVNVADMDVSTNLIMELTDTSFPLNSGMTSLTLDTNPIYKISALAFANLKQLSFLSLTNTKLTRLPISLSYLTNLQTVDLSSNDGLVCTCLEKRLLDLYLSFNVGIDGDCGVTTIQYFLIVLSIDCPDS